MDAGKRGDRAGCADQMKVLGTLLVRGTDRRAIELRQHALDLIDHAGKDGRRDITAAMAFRQRHDADRQRGPVGNVVGEPRRAAVADADDRDFRRTAADIKQHDGAGLATDQRRAAGHGKPRLGFAIDDFELEPGFLSDPRQKCLAVFGSAAGFGGNQPHAADRPVRKFRRAHAQGIDGAIHRFRRQATACSQPLAQTDNARKRVDDPELARPRRLGDQETAIVGAEIKGCIEFVAEACELVGAGRTMDFMPERRITGMACGRNRLGGDQRSLLGLRQRPTLRAPTGTLLLAALIAILLRALLARLLSDRLRVTAQAFARRRISTNRSIATLRRWIRRMCGVLRDRGARTGATALALARMR